MVRGCQEGRQARVWEPAVPDCEKGCPILERVQAGVKDMPSLHKLCAPGL